MNTHAPTLKKTAIALAAAEAGLSTIDIAIAAVPVPASGTGVTAAKLRATVEDANAEVTLAELSGNDAAPAAKRLAEARATLSGIEEVSKVNSEKRAGLERMRIAAWEEVDRQTTAFNECKRAYLLEEANAADLLFIEHAKEIHRAQRRLLACRSALRALGFESFPGRGDLIDIPAIGPVSAQIARDTYNASSGGWGERFLPMLDLPSELRAVQLEIAAISAVDKVPAKGVVARVFSAIGKTAS